MIIQWVSDEVEKGRTQLSENLRLRIGLWLILLIALFYSNLVLRDLNDDKKEKLVRLERLQSEQLELEGSKLWQERLEEVKNLLEKQAVYFASAESEAYGKADVQAFVAQLLNKHDLNRVRIELSTSAETDKSSGLVPVQFRLAGEAPIAQLMALLHRLETARPSYYVSSLNIQSRSNDIVTFDLIATVWFLPWGEKK